MKRPVTIAVVGFGGRGRRAYTSYIMKHPEEMKLVAVADIDPEVRALAISEYGIAPEDCYEDGAAFFAKEKMADAVIIATPDRTHFELASMAFEKQYTVLLEKPISHEISECVELERRAAEHGTKVMVCHVLRYTPFYQKIKSVIESGQIGEVVTMQAIEKVGYWHQAHSFVRGNWRNSDETAPMILAKSCHDVDILLWLMNKSCVRVSSTGSLFEFNSAKAPAGAAKRCLDGCAAKENCPYDAEKIYIDHALVKKDFASWTLPVLALDPTRENVLQALKTGPYGRCVYACDNNVVDHQAVNMEFEDGSVASFVMCGLTHECSREIRVMGTRGDIVGDLDAGLVKVTPFGKDTVVYDLNEGVEGISGHGGGDDRLMEDFVAFVAGDGAKALTTLSQSIQSHLIALGAEKSRLEGSKPVCLAELG